MGHSGRECVRGEGGRDGGGLVNFAARGGVDGVLIMGVAVHAFDDIDFAVVGPLVADGPESRPGTRLEHIMNCVERHCLTRISENRQG